MQVFHRFFCFLLCLSYIVSVGATEVEIKIARGLFYGYNMGASEPTDPYFGGEPIEISIQDASSIQSASFTFTSGPTVIDRIEVITGANQFEASFFQSNGRIQVELIRITQETTEKIDLQLVIDRFAFNKGLQDTLEVYFDLGFGEFRIIESEIVGINNQSINAKLNHGTWLVITDYAFPVQLQLVSSLDGLPLPEIKVYVTGYGNIPHFFESPMEQGRTNENGIVWMVLASTPDLLFFEEGGCYVPRIHSMDFWLLIEPPEDSFYDQRTLKVTVPTNTSCGAIEFFQNVTLELTPKSGAQLWELYQ